MTYKVLVPVNDQASALVAVECAMARNWQPGTKFLLCTIVEELGSKAGDLSVQHHEVLASEQKLNAMHMELWLRRIHKVFAQALPESERLIDSGAVPSKICALAKDWDADYILMGSHRFGAPNKLALRGVAAQVVAYAPCTVEAVRFPQLQEAASVPRTFDVENLRNLVSRAPRKVLIATDHSLQAEVALAWAAEQDWGKDCQIGIATVFVSDRREAGRSIYEKVHSRSEEQRYERHLMDELKVQAAKFWARKPEAILELFLVHDETPWMGIVAQAKSWGTELVILGAQGGERSDESRAVSNAVDTMEHLDCSVIAVRRSERESVHFSWIDEVQSN